MCIISDNIKFCSCVDPNIDVKQLNNYWVLIRIHKNRKHGLLGEARKFEYKLPEGHEENKLKLLSALHTKDAFDKRIVFKEEDRLHVFLNAAQNDHRTMEFKFLFSSGKWEYIKDMDCFFHWNTLKDVALGEVEEFQ